ncbi:major facilitator superfamily transporter [Xylariales sp. PMI_506]|nr:major facilitator superfamily transporter [Xylariales sp. PMI_506]
MTPPDGEKVHGIGDVANDSSSAEQDAINKPTELPPARFWLLALGLGLGLLLSFMDSSIVATSLFSIGNEFDDLTTVNWVALAYTLCYLGFAVFFARLSDVIGRRNSFMLAYLIFFGFSIGCGFAQNMKQLIVCRAFQGIGGSGLYSITMIIFLEITPIRMKQFLASLVGAIIAIGGVLGPVLGGILTHYTTWRWVFWINGPIGFLSMVLFYLTWPKAEYLPDVERRTWGELDYVGSFLLISAAVLVVFPFQNASSGALWSQPVFIAPIVIGIVCCFGLVVWEIFVERRWGDRIAAAFPMRLMQNRIYMAAVANTLFLGFPFIMLVYAFPLRLQIVNGKTSLLAGVMLLPLLGGSATGSVLAGAINGKKDRTFETLVAASCLVSIGCGLMSTLSGSFNLEAKGLGFLVFIGSGFGLSAAATTMMGGIRAPIRDHSPAQGILAQLRILGGSLGIAASSAILGVTLRAQLTGIVDPSVLGSLEASTSSLTSVQMEAVRQAYSDAFDKDMRVATIVACVGVLLAFGSWTRDRPDPRERNKQLIKEEVERRKAASAGNIEISS